MLAAHTAHVAGRRGELVEGIIPSRLPGCEEIEMGLLIN